MYEPVLPKEKFEEGSPWHGPVSSDKYDAIKEEIILNKRIIKTLKEG